MFSLIIKRYDIIFFTLLFCVSSLNDVSGVGWRTPDDKTKCPKVRGIRNFDISKVRFYKLSFSLYKTRFYFHIINAILFKFFISSKQLVHNNIFYNIILYDKHFIFRDRIIIRNKKLFIKKKQDESKFIRC